MRIYYTTHFGRRSVGHPLRDFEIQGKLDILTWSQSDRKTFIKGWPIVVLLQGDVTYDPDLTTPEKIAECVTALGKIT